MAARDSLHVSYLGEDASTGSVRNPATPLAELLQFLDEQFGVADNDARPWLVKHPLQPFDARYYRSADAQADPRLFTYSRAFAELPELGAADSPPFFELQPAKGNEISDCDVNIATLRRFWRDPLKAALRDRAGVSLEVLADDSWPDREPMQASVERRELIESRLLQEALRSGGAVPQAAPPWLALSGVLAAGPAGELAYAQARDCASAALEFAREPLGGAPRMAAQTVDLDLGDAMRVRGLVERVYRSADGALWLFDAKPWRRAEFRDLVPFYIDWAALRLTLGDIVQAHFVEKDEKYKNGNKAAAPPLLQAMVQQTPAQLRDGLRRLVAASLDPQPLLFPPQTAWAWADHVPGKRESKARLAWEGDGFGTRGERRHAPGYAGLLGRDLKLFEPANDAHRRFIAAVQLVCDVLDPERRVLPMEAT